MRSFVALVAIVAVVAAGVVLALPAQTPPAQTPPAQTPPPSQQPPQQQTPDQPRPIFRAGVDVVQLELTVLDADYKPVHGLTKADFQVSEDGDRQDIVDVREIFVDDGTPPPVWSRAVSPDIATNDLAERRLIGIVLDDLRCCSAASTGMTDATTVSEMRATADAIVSNLGPHDLATVVLTHELAAMQPFTADRDALRSTIGRFSPGTDLSCLPAPPWPDLTYDLRLLMAMSSQPVKMIVTIWSPTGLGIQRPLPCPPRSYVVPDIGRRVTVTTPPPGPREPDPRGLPPVPMYRIAAGRGFDFLAVRQQRFDNPNALMGGSELDETLDKIFSQNESYYLLGFRTSRPTTDGKYRRLDIKVPGKKGYTVRSRAGYLRPTPAPKPGSRAARDPELPRPSSTVSNLLPNTDITMQTAVAAFAIPGSRKNALVVALDLAHPVREDIPSGGEDLDVRTVVYASGDPKQDRTVKVKLSVPAGQNRVTASVPARLDVDPDRYELWLSARDPRTTRIGSVFYDIEVPDRATHAISLSGVVLGHEPTDTVPVPAVYNGIVPIVPTPSRQFGQADAITAFFEVYQGLQTPVAPVPLQIRIVDDRGVAKHAVDEVLPAERFEPSRSADYRLKMPFDKLTAGRYLLTIDAKIGGKISPRRDVMFSVR